MARRLDAHRLQFASLHNDLYLEAASTSQSRSQEPHFLQNASARLRVVQNGYSKEAAASFGLDHIEDSAIALHSLYVHDVLPTVQLLNG